MMCHRYEDCFHITDRRKSSRNSREFLVCEGFVDLTGVVKFSPTFVITHAAAMFNITRQ